jgi:hypothetical protein
LKQPEQEDRNADIGLDRRVSRHRERGDRQVEGQLMTTTSISHPASHFEPTSGSGAVPLSPPTTSIIPDEVDGRSRNAHSFLSAIQAFLSGLTDGRAFQSVSLGREASIIFTASGPLIYRLELNNRKSSLSGHDY